VHLVLAPFQPGEEALQAAETAGRDPVDDQVEMLRTQLREGNVDREVVVVGQVEQLLQLMCIGRAVPRRDGTFAECLSGVGNDQLHVQVDHVAEPFALRTGAQRAVEAVQARLGIGEIQLAVDAGEARAEAHPPPRPAIDRVDHAPSTGRRNRRLTIFHQRVALAPALGKRRLQRVTDPRCRNDSRHKPIDHHVPLAAGRRLPGPTNVEGLAGEVYQVAVGDHADETLFGQRGGQSRAVFVIRHAGREGNHVASALGERPQHFGRALGRIAADFVPTLRADHAADLGVQQTQVIGRLGDRAHGRPTGAAGVPARHGDGRGDTVDPLRLRLFQPPEKLPGIGGEAFDVPALPLGVERVQRQAALAASAQPAQHDQVLVRDVQVDRLEVMYLDPPQDNVPGNPHGVSQAVLVGQVQTTRRICFSMSLSGAGLPTPPAGVTVRRPCHNGLQHVGS